VTNNQLLVFPTSRAIREYIEKQKGVNDLIPKTITIDELFKNTLFLKKRKYIEDNLRIVYLKEAMQKSDFDSLGISQNFSEFFKQSDFIFRFLGELSHEGVSIETLKNFDTYVAYEDHLNILQNIEKNYLQILEEKNLVDKINLPQNYEIFDEFLENFSSCDIFLEGYLSGFEFTIIKQMATKVQINLHFEYNQFNEKSIKQLSNEDLFSVGNSYCFDLTNNLIKSETKRNNSLPIINVQDFPSKIDQIAFIKQSIFHMVHNRNIDPENIVVVLPDEKFADTLKLFDSENYFNFAMGFSIKDSKLYETIISIDRFCNDSNDQTKAKLDFLNIDFNIVNAFNDNWNNSYKEELFKKLKSYLFEVEENENIAIEYEKIDYSLFHLMNNHKINLTVKEYFKILLQKLNKVTIDDTRGGKITVMGILETRSINFDAVIIVDFNDHIVPKKSDKDKFLSTSIKQLASLPTSKDRQNLQIYYYHKLIQGTKEVNISYVQNEQYTVSRFFNILFDGQKVNMNFNYQHILFSKDTKKELNDTIIEDIDLTKKMWSASSLKRYLQCPRMYYYHDIKKLREHHFSLKPQNFEIGTILHDILENIYTKQRVFTSSSDLYTTILKEFENIKQFNPYLIFEIELWKKKIYKFVENEIKRFEKNIKVLDCERVFKLNYNGININGKIDRIDILEDGKIDILDYKSSKSLKIDTKSNFEKSVDFQLEFYYLALSQSHEINEVCYYDLTTGITKDETMLDEKLKVLDTIFENLPKKEVNFEKCDNKQLCSQCNFNTICQRD
jgi:ATP-dependent helicase/nuclease subunit B